jgi:protein tyrosine phosphatase (PTP) superfamily phosphohydrolase (DUF442 family)
METSRGTRAPALLQLAVLIFGVQGYAQPVATGRVGELTGARRTQQNQAASPARPDPTMATRVSISGVRNFGEVTPTLYRGGKASEDGFRNLANMGVTIVVDLSTTGRAHERDEVTALGMRYVSIPWDCFTVNDSDVARFLAIMRENPGKKVFVHCFTGDDRTGMEIAAYRMAEQKWSAEQARKEMEAFGFDFFHRRICPRLGAYETHFPNRLANDAAFEQFRSNSAPTDAAPSR